MHESNTGKRLYRIKQFAIILILFVLIMLIFCEQILSAQKRSVAETTNIHFTGEYCKECHTKIPNQGGNKYLKYEGDFKRLCNCHNRTVGSFLHPVDMDMSSGKKAKIPPDMPLRNGEVTCLTCHDMFLQCRKRLFRNEKLTLRGAPYPRKTDFCYKCHNKNDYTMLNPHDQISDSGEIVFEICLYCHEGKPDETRHRYKDVKFIGDLEMICQRCHMIKYNHSGNYSHMVKPSDKGLARIEAMKNKFDIILPLAKDGKMTCITCHNSHEKGVIPDESPGSKGADSPFRHRLPGRLCLECHQK